METVLHSFQGGSDGRNPWGPVTVDATGNLYGTTTNGSTFGTVFRLKPPARQGGSWDFGVLYGFLGPPDGSFPTAGLIFDKSGSLYRTTEGGGTGQGCGGTKGSCGTLFKIGQ